MKYVDNKPALAIIEEGRAQALKWGYRKGYPICYFGDKSERLGPCVKCFLNIRQTGIACSEQAGDAAADLMAEEIKLRTGYLPE